MRRVTLIAVLCSTLSAWSQGSAGSAAAEARAGLTGGLWRGAVFARGDGGPVGVVGEAAPGRPMSEKTFFDMASVTKTFTAAAAALLVAEDKLDVEKLHKLATHTTTGKFKYDCANFVELGKEVERASGMRLDAFCRDRLFRPLGMTRTRWWPVKDDGTLCQMLPEGTPPGVVSDRHARAFGVPVGNAGAFSDIRDMRLFVTDLLTRKTFPKAYYDLLLTCRYEEEGGIRYSFGFDMSDKMRPAGLSRAAIFHSGWTGQTIAVDPATGFCGVVLTARTGDHNQAKEARNRVLAALVPDRSEAIRREVRELSRWIWSNPELSYREFGACQRQSAFLSAHGFSVTTNYLGLATAYRAEFANGADHPSFGFAVEYDALPDIGHACGHNLNCGNALAAALFLKEKMLATGVRGKVVLLGCPAEESGGGKCDMAAKGATDGIDAIMMSHANPGQKALGDPGYSGVRTATAVYKGTGGSGVARCANPAFSNPLDAQTLLYQAVAMRRHFLPRDMAVIGVISEAGKAANVLPPETKSVYTVRCKDVKRLEAYEAEFRRMAEGAAMMTGTTLDFSYTGKYQPTKPNYVLGDFYIAELAKRGYETATFHDRECFAGTDFGCFTQLVPGVHNHFPVFSDADVHTSGFAAACNTDKAYAAMFDSAEAMAAAAFKYLSNGDFRKRTNDFFTGNPQKESK